MLEITTLYEFKNFTRGDGVVDFAKRSGCVPCQRLEPHLKSASARVDIPFGKVYLDLSDEDLLNHVVTVLGIKSTPTLYLYENGKVVRAIESRTAPGIIKELS